MKSIEQYDIQDFKPDTIQLAINPVLGAYNQGITLVAIIKLAKRSPNTKTLFASLKDVRAGLLDIMPSEATRAAVDSLDADGFIKLTLDHDGMIKIPQGIERTIIHLCRSIQVDI